MPESHVPAPQVVLHAPQWSGSEVVSTQPIVAPQKTWLPVQWHAPEMQVPSPQSLPHVPQFFGSEEVSAQAVGQMVVLLGQAPHTPDSHGWPVRHARSHPPQFFGSLETSTQPDWQVTSVESHVQTPFTHEAPGLQVVPPHWTPPEPVDPCAEPEPLLP
jgi:hypothetical protein